ncbi:hypothetical protein OH749_31345 (plasmid) [Streptomyces albidoflavus]|nr:hypothetical protein OH749_31345 [Streptomyces albidoflavus]
MTDTTTESTPAAETVTEVAAAALAGLAGAGVSTTALHGLIGH